MASQSNYIINLASEKISILRKKPFLIAAFLILFTAFLILIFQVFFERRKTSPDLPAEENQNPLIKKQIDELNELRKAGGVQSAEENKQIEELDSLRQESQQAASPKKIEQQIEELNKIRQMSQ